MSFPIVGLTLTGLSFFGAARGSPRAAGWPVLMKTNYVDSSSIVKVKLQARQMWEAVDHSDLASTTSDSSADWIPQGP